MVDRERLGAEIIGNILGSTPQYGGAPVIRVGTSPAYVLAAAIKGRPLNRVLAAHAWFPRRIADATLTESFATLGMLLGTLHSQASLPSDAPKATKRVFATLGKALDQVTSGDLVVDVIAKWYAAHAREDQGNTFVHGNMRLDNAIRVGARIGLVDFEHCGAGSQCLDLTRPITQLLLARALVIFPYERAARCLRAYLNAYEQIHRYSMDELEDYVCARAALYYLETKSGRIPSRIGGLPILRSRLGRLTTALLRNGVNKMIAGRSATIVCVV
jgi:Ser/Thr protein kinase RdoA (MazF antagonist)